MYEGDLNNSFESNCFYTDARPVDLPVLSKDSMSHLLSQTVDATVNLRNERYYLLKLNDSR